jgi:hypothetical protein
MDALVAQIVMRWKDVQRQGDRHWGRKQDRGGRWRSATVPEYSQDPTTSYLVEERMKELGLWEKYQKGLAKITQAHKLPCGWASPEQRCRAALGAVRNSKLRRIA